MQGRSTRWFSFVLTVPAGQAKQALGAEAIEALADRGYYDGKELLACGKTA
jgi:hypothetical protein